VDNLVGLSSTDPLSQPTHRRSIPSLPTTSVVHSSSARVTHSMPIPRPSSSIRRPINNTSESTTPLSHSPSSTESPFPFSPLATNPASYVSNGTHLTTPPSSASLSSNLPPPYPAPNPHALTYPSVPPPSLSSSYGSPVISHRENSTASADALRTSGSDRRIAESGTFRNGRSRSHRESVERGARIAEMGTLVPRSRAGSQSLGTPFETEHLT